MGELASTLRANNINLKFGALVEMMLERSLDPVLCLFP